jgi:hypothetical protein
LGLSGRNYARIRDAIHRHCGFENFNERIRGAVFACRILCATGVNSPTRQEKEIHGPQNPESAPGARAILDDTIRSHDQFNTTIYGLDDRYRGIYNGRRVIFMNPNDIREARLQPGQFVDLTSHFQGERRTAAHFQIAPYEIPRRCTATYYPEANPLVHIGSVCEFSNTPASKSVVITIEPSGYRRLHQLSWDVAGAAGHRSEVSAR